MKLVIVLLQLVAVASFATSRTLLFGSSNPPDYSSDDTCSARSFSVCSIPTTHDLVELARARLASAASQGEFDQIVADITAGLPPYVAEGDFFLWMHKHQQPLGSAAVPDDKCIDILAKASSLVTHTGTTCSDIIEAGQLPADGLSGLWVDYHGDTNSNEVVEKHAWVVPVDDPSGQRYSLGSSFDASTHDDQAQADDAKKVCSALDFTPCSLRTAHGLAEASAAALNGAATMQEWDAIAAAITAQAEEHRDKNGFYIFLCEFIPDDFVVVAHAGNPSLVGELGHTFLQPNLWLLFQEAVDKQGGWVYYLWDMPLVPTDDVPGIWKFSWALPVSSPARRFFLGAGFDVPQ